MRKPSQLSALRTAALILLAAPAALFAQIGGAGGTIWGGSFTTTYAAIAFGQADLLIPPIIQAATVLQATSDAANNALGQQLSLLRVEAGDFSVARFDGADVDASAMLAGNETAAPGGYRGVNPPAKRLEFFFAGTGSFGEINPGLGFSSNFYSGGGLAGAAYRLTHDFTVGVYTGYDHAKLSYFQSSSTLKIDTARFGTFATWDDHRGDWVNISVGGAYHDLSSRSPDFGDPSTEETGGLEFDTTATYGHDFKLRQWTLTPTFGLAYIHQKNDATNGDGITFGYDPAPTNSLRTELGATVAYALKTGAVEWSPYIQGGWNHELLDAVAQTEVSFGGADIGPLTSGNVGRERATFGAGVNARFTPTLSGSLSYAGQANSQYEEHTFQASVGLAF